ncbi:MAG: hypothetical protein ACE5FO_01980 [Parvularculaceae bacterium]
MDAKEILAVLFGVVAVLGVFGGIVNRIQLRKGIGAQFIRYNAITVALPAAVSLAFLGMLTEAAVTVLTGALGYVFAGVAGSDG